MIPLEAMLEIQNLHRQGLSDRQIARRLGINRRTVRHYLAHPEQIQAPRTRTPPPSLIDPYRDQIAAYLDEDPDYRATWIFDRLQRGGYPGGYELVKRAVRTLKHDKTKKAYVRFETEPGLQAQG